MEYGPRWRRLLGWLAVLAVLAAPALAAEARIVRTSPEVRPAPPGGVVTHVFAVYGSGSVTPSFSSEHGWPLLSPERRLELDPEKATYLAVSVRVPPGTPEGRRDRLTVRVAGAEAFAYSQAAFAPGLEASWPRTVEYVPPVGYLPLKIRNAGNGPDTFLIRLESVSGDPVFSSRVALEAGGTSELRIPITAYDTYKLVVVSLRSREKKEGLVIVSPGRAGGGEGFRLIGRLGAAYNYPGSFSVSAGLAGPLSDFAYLNFGVGYSLGGLPAGSASLSFEGGYFSVSYGRSYGVALGFHEEGLSVALAFSGPEPRGSFNLDYTAAAASYGLSASLSRDPSFRLYAQLGIHARASNLVPELESDTLRGELTLTPLEPRAGALVSYAFRYRDWPLNLRYEADWRSGEPLTSSFSADADPSEASFGGRISWSGLGVKDWGLALASNSQRLKIETPLPFYLGASAGADRFLAFAGATIDLPEPWSDLGGRVEAEYAAGSWSFTVSGSSRASSFEGMTLWDVGGRLGWPLTENQLSLGVRAGGSYLRGHASLDWSPWKPGLETRLGLEMPAGGAMLRAEAGREWYSGKTSFGLSADLPWVVGVPPEVTEFFGGRRVGVVAGVVEVQGPARFRQGIPVRAGGVETVTDAAGRFELQLPPGEYTVEIDRGRLPAILVAVRESQKVRLELKQKVEVRLAVAVRAVLEGRVTVSGPAPERPPRFAVAVTDERGRETSLYTDSDGGFRLEGLAPGVYTVRLLTRLLPPGWKAIRDEATVLLAAGETGRVELEAAAPERRVYRGGLQILEVKPEVATAPPGSAPLVTVRLNGEAERVLIEEKTRVLGVLLPAGEAGTWSGRLRLPEDYQGPLQLQVVAQAGGEEARYPFFVSVSPTAPWGVLRTLPVARPGQRLPVAVHWYAPASECWLEVAGERVELSGDGADWQGEITVPQNAQNKLELEAAARLQGRPGTVTIKRFVLIR